jgi:hypothetical protein
MSSLAQLPRAQLGEILKMQYSVTLSLEEIGARASRQA